MEYIILSGTDVRVSRLSFGTASLHRLFFSFERQKMLYKAFDEGITHFDTSPYYGYGIAEIELGKFLKGRRNYLTVTTKIGLYPPLDKTANLTLEVWIRKIIGKIYKPLSRPFINWSIEKANSSLNASLKRLNTDYVDFLFLHEPDIALINTDEFLNWLTRVQIEGKIRYWGLAGERTHVEPWLKVEHPFCKVIQTRDSLTRKEANFLFKYGRKFQFTYGYLSTDINRISIGAKEIIRLALKRNNEGSILFSTNKIKHLEEIVSIFKGENI